MARYPASAKRDDVRLVIKEPEPKASKPAEVVSILDKSPSGPAATAKTKAKLFSGGIAAAVKATKPGKPEKKAKPKTAKKAAHKPAKKAKAPKTYEVKFDVARIVRLYDRGKGKSVSEIAQAIGYPEGHGNNRVATCLIKEGVYKGTRTE